MQRLVPAGKYADVRRSVPTRQSAQAGTTQPRPAPSSGSPAGAFNFYIPRPGALVGMDEWFWRELREGGYLAQYLARERARHKDHVRTIGRRYVDYRPNARSDWQLKAAVPSRLYHRWAKEDRDFWRDDKNLRSLKRDNPELSIFV